MGDKITPEAVERWHKLSDEEAGADFDLIGSMVPDTAGEWVRASDYDILAAELAEAKAEIERLCADQTQSGIDYCALMERHDEQINEIARLTRELAEARAALTPSAETKAAYMGEFSVPFPHVDEDGDEVISHVNVPWTTIKQIMAAIKARAALGEAG